MHLAFRRLVTRAIAGKARSRALAASTAAPPRCASRAPPALRRLAATALALIAASCGGGLPRPPIRVPPDAYVEVPYPPPPARVEIVPDRPRDDAVWVDGSWSWVAGGWVWLPGAWVVPAPGSWYAPWATERAADGRLFFSPSSWRSPDGRRVPGPPPIARPKTGTQG